MKDPVSILYQYWGHQDFRPLQEEIIQSVLQGQDTVALLPTGGGKSLCFQIPALIMEGICIVISPLVALMNDQVASLKDKGIKALSLTGGISQEELTTLLDNALFGNYKFLYCSPERLQQEQVQEAIRKMQVNLIAVDEAHCISQWGNDFRPAYQNLQILRELHPYVPTIALTATATPEVLTDTISQLQLEDPQIFKKSFARHNLSYQVFEESDKLNQLVRLMEKYPGTAIIYLRNRKQTEFFSKHLNSQGISSSFYHGGLQPKEKSKRLEAWKNGAIIAMVATNAFGMGIDHAGVRLVVHAQLPDSLESYFQEAGRAGRDEKPAYAVLLYESYDKQLLKKQFLESQPSVKELKKLYRTLNNYFQISYGEGVFTEHQFSLTRFCQTYSLPILNVYNGLQALDRIGVLQLSQQFGRKSKIQFLVTSEVLLKRFEENPSFSMIGKTLLRMYGGLFESVIPINLDWVSNKSGIAAERIISVLQEMEKENLVSLQLFDTDSRITFLVPREDDRTINPFSKTIKKLYQQKEKQVDAVLKYIENDRICKQVQLLQYFGETDASPCGHCSVCMKKSGKATNRHTENIHTQILKLLQEESMDSRSLVESLTFAEEEVLKALQWLLDRKKIRINAINQYYKNE